MPLSVLAKPRCATGSGRSALAACRKGARLAGGAAGRTERCFNGNGHLEGKRHAMQPNGQRLAHPHPFAATPSYSLLSWPAGNTWLSGTLESCSGVVQARSGSEQAVSSCSRRGRGGGMCRHAVSARCGKWPASTQAFTGVQGAVEVPRVCGILKNQDEPSKSGGNHKWPQSLFTVAAGN